MAFRKFSLVTQSDDIVTIPQNGTPIIYIATHAVGYVAARVAMTVNLLRSGCPAVQLLWIGLNIHEEVGNLFAAIQLSDERFISEYTFSPQRNATIAKLLVTREARMQGKEKE